MNRAKGSPLQKDGLIRNKIWPTACFYGKLPRQLRKGNGGGARHTTTGQYYRELKRQTGELEANVRQLQTEQQQAEQQLVEARKEIMSEMLCRLKTEKDFDNKG